MARRKLVAVVPDRSPNWFRIGITGRPSANPIRHAVDSVPPKASRTGKNFRAICGASVAEVLDGAFSFHHPRSCKKCADLA